MTDKDRGTDGGQGKKPGSAYTPAHARAEKKYRAKSTITYTVRYTIGHPVQTALVQYMEETGQTGRGAVMTLIAYALTDKGYLP